MDYDLLFSDDGKTVLGIKSGWVQELTIPEGVINIEDNAFEWCGTLRTVHLPSSLVRIGVRAFANCMALTNIVLPNNLEKIGNFAFCNDKSLKIVKIPDSVKTLGECIFLSCISLREVKLPNNIITIPRLSFERCTSLEIIDIPNSVQYLGDSAFQDCSLLRTIKGGRNISKIGFCVFEGCYSLVENELSSKNVEVEDIFASISSIDNAPTTRKRIGFIDPDISNNEVEIETDIKSKSNIVNNENNMKLESFISSIPNSLDVTLVEYPDRLCLYREHDEDEFDADSSIEELNNVHKILKNHGVVHSSIIIDDKGPRKAGTRHIDILLSDNVNWVDPMARKYTFDINISNWNNAISGTDKQDVIKKILDLSVREVIQMSNDSIEDCIDLEEEDFDLLDEL